MKKKLFVSSIQRDDMRWLNDAADDAHTNDAAQKQTGNGLCNL